MQSKHLFTLPLVASLLVTSLPLSVLAADNTPNPTVRTTHTSIPVSDSSFCKSLSTNETRVLAQITTNGSKRDTWRAQEAARQQAYWDTLTADLTSRRQHWDSLRVADFAKLLARAKTDAQRQAVTTFENQVAAAVQAKYAADDAATSAFRSGWQTAQQTKYAAVDQSITAFHSSVASAFQTASAACASGQNVDTNRSTLQAALKSGKGVFQASYNSAAQTQKTTGSSLEATRRTAYQASAAAYKTALEAARAALKAAFGETSTAAPKA